MSFVSRLLKTFLPQERDDPFFGRVKYMKMPRGRILYWEASRLFIPTFREIELSLMHPHRSSYQMTCDVN